jgi:hypothetical protein
VLSRPGPATASPLARCCDRWMTISRHPGPWSSHAVLTGHDLTCGPSFRTTRAPTFHRRGSLRLGPRSPDPDRSFWSAFAGLIRDQMPPTDFCNCVTTTCGHQARALVPRWDDGLDHLPVLTWRRPLPCGSGSKRRAALRPVSVTPLPVPPACAGLPDVDTTATAPPPNAFWDAGV